VGDSETPLTGGWVTQDVVRVGDTVRRPPSPNSAFVERLLVHLEEVGFEAAPRFLGFDEQGRQILTFIEGHVPSDCRAMVWEDTQLEAAATLLRGYHDVTTATDLAEGDIVCHNDSAPGTSSGGTGDRSRSSTSTTRPRASDSTTSATRPGSTSTSGSSSCPRGSSGAGFG